MRTVDLYNDESPNQESLRCKKVRQKDVSNRLSRMNMKIAKTCSSRHTFLFLNKPCNSNALSCESFFLESSTSFPKQGKYE